MACDVAEYKIVVDNGRSTVEVDVVEVRTARAYGVERWGVGVGRKGRLLDYFEYARQRDTITAIYHPIPPDAPLCSPMPAPIHDAIVVRLKLVAVSRYESEVNA
jgi:hypothetical protein